MDLFEQYIELFHGLETERKTHYMKRAHQPTPRQPYQPVPSERIEWFERLQDASGVCGNCDNEPNENDIQCLRLLADNATIDQLRRALGISHDALKAIYYRLANFGLAELQSNRRYRPTDAGFALLGIEPTEPPKQGGKKGQSIYFNRGR